jgi:tetratricopeptide (TPR) repeat protein
MRTFIYGLEDIDRAADALKQAQRFGFTPGDRETAQLADGYRTRGETIWRTAGSVEGMEQEAEYLERAADSLRQALRLYSRIPAYAGATIYLRRTQRALQLIQARIEFLAGHEPDEDGGWR